jgi:hypothetical protein
MLDKNTRQVVIIAFVLVVTTVVFVVKIATFFSHAGPSLDQQKSRVSAPQLYEENQPISVEESTTYGTDRETPLVLISKQDDGWETYHNLKYHFTLRYPSGWNPEIWGFNESGINLLGPERQRELRNDNPELIHEFPDIAVTVMKKGQADYIISYNRYDQQYATESIVIDGKVAKRYEIRATDEGAKEEVYLYIGNDVIIFARLGLDKKVFDAILASFRFTQ